MSKLEPATLRRYQERGLYDVASAKAVFDDSFIAHVSYIDDGYPACQPMLTLIREEEEDVPEGEEAEATDSNGTTNGTTSGTTNGESGHGRRKTAYAYLHGHPTTRLMELVKKANKDAEAAEEATAATNGNGPVTNGHAALVEPIKVCITATKSMFNPLNFVKAGGSGKVEEEGKTDG